MNFIESELEQPQPIVPDEESPHSPTAMSPGSVVSSTPKADKTRSPELQARIERLRAQGWERKRFDARRYAELRESASADMAG
jgi:hypothetical protein